MRVYTSMPMPMPVPVSTVSARLVVLVGYQTLMTFQQEAEQPSMS
jgi:hypothetical protein